MNSELSYWQQLDALAAQWRESKKIPSQSKLKLEKEKARLTPLTLLEISLVEKLQGCVTFPAGSSHKRFIRGLSDKSQLSDRGRAYLAYIAQRYRRQWTANEAEFNWIVQWGVYIR